ncbi:MAG TPA: c-type cytochrome, partial [Candidatus Methylacidiphilales bacterium]
EGPVWHGAQLFQEKGCINCHSLAKNGGRRGPDLTYVGDRLHKDNLTIRINMGGVNMPPYAGSLTADEVRDLVAFLETRKKKEGATGEDTMIRMQKP